MKQSTLHNRFKIIVIVFSLLLLCACSKTANQTSNQTEPTIKQVNFEQYFDGIHGSAVIYQPLNNNYQIYNQEPAMTQRSPCSTFKIVSSLIAFENKIIEPTNSMRKWSSEVFWNKAWNKNIEFKDAFQSSCVWYFRKIIDEIGKRKYKTH